MNRKWKFVFILFFGGIITGCENLDDLVEECLLFEPVVEIFLDSSIPTQVELKINGETFLNECNDTHNNPDGRYYTYSQQPYDLSGNPILLAVAPTDPEEGNGLQLPIMFDIEILDCTDSTVFLSLSQAAPEYSPGQCQENYDVGVLRLDQ